MKTLPLYLIGLLLLNVLHGRKIVPRCPADVTEWFARSRAMECKVGLYYHCILSYNDTLYEVCMARKLFESNQGGCPWIDFYKNEPVFGAIATQCPSDVEGCPPRKHHGFASDQIYQYPLCFLPENDRHEKAKSLPVTPMYSLTTNVPQYDVDDRLDIVVIVLMVLVLFVVFVILLYEMRSVVRRVNCLRRRKEGHTEDPLLSGIVSRARMKYKFIWRCGFEWNEETQKAYDEAFHSGSWVFTFKCSDDRELENQMALFKEKMSSTHDYTSRGLYLEKHTIHAITTESQMQNMIVYVLFFDVTRTTTEKVIRFTKFLRENFSVKCIAYTDIADIFPNTNGIFTASRETSDEENLMYSEIPERLDRECGYHDVPKYEISHAADEANLMYPKIPKGLDRECGYHDVPKYKISHAADVHDLLKSHLKT